MSARMLVSFEDLNEKLGIGYSRTEIDRKEKSGKFPKSFKLAEGRGARRVWYLSEVIQWIEMRARRSDSSDDK